MRRAARVDANQKEIVRAWRQVGARVALTHMVGNGFPDAVVGFRGQVLLCLYILMNITSHLPLAFLKRYFVCVYAIGTIEDIGGLVSIDRAATRAHKPLSKPSPALVTLAI